MLMMGISIIAGSLLSSAIEPINNVIRQELNSLIRREIPSPSILIELRYKGLITEQEFITLMAKHGINEEVAVKMFKAAEEALGIGDIISLYRRGLINETKYKSLLLERGVTDANRMLFEKATEFLPSVNDIIRFAVREAFTPETVSKFGLDQDIPQEYLVYAKKLGLREEDARLYWRAHWELPSIEMALEMFHRGIISIKELEMLLKAQDVMPFWRDKILQLSYNLPTRVDLRRMYRIGVVDKNYVFDIYRKMGYDPETAEALTKFTVLTEVENEKELSKIDIINAYKDGTLNRDAAKENLIAIGYSENAAELILLIADNDIAKDKIKVDIEVLESKYIMGEIGDEELHDKLLMLGLSAAKAAREYNRIINNKKKSVKKLDKDEYIKMAKEGVIKIKELKEELKLMGYSNKDIERLLRLHKLEGGEQNEL